MYILDSVRPTHTHLSRCVGLRIFQSRASRANNITRQCLISFWAFWKSRSFVFKRRVVFIVYLCCDGCGVYYKGGHTQKKRVSSGYFVNDVIQTWSTLFWTKKEKKIERISLCTSRSELVGYLMDFRESFNIWEMGQDDRRVFGQSILYDDRTETPLINHSTKF